MIVISIAFMVVAGGNPSVNSVSSFEVELLGLGTTLGIVAQTVALIPALRQVSFRWRPRFDFRRSEFAEIGRMSGWMLGYVATTQVAFAVTARVANHVSGDHGFTAYSYAWLLFQLPYAVVSLSVITALLPRMSAHAAERRYQLVRDDFQPACGSARSSSCWRRSCSPHSARRCRSCCSPTSVRRRAPPAISGWCSRSSPSG